MNDIPGEAAGNAVASQPSAVSGAADPWLKLAQDAYKRSTTYFDNNYRKTWEDGIRIFNSQHPRDSKYNSDAFKYRSRIFRPKSRSVARKHEATLAMALFSNPDVVSIDPMNPEDDAQIVSAQVNKELLQYRLTSTKNGVNWFLLSIGAFQDSMKVGICASLQYWDYVTRKQKVQKTASFQGQEFPFEVEEEVPVVDKPCSELIAIENIRFDPAAKWYDVVGTSPYLVLEMPMYLRDVLDRMENAYGKNQKPWKTLDEKVILEARVTDASSIQQARDGRREDPKTVTSEVNEFDVVMVHLNFIRTGDGTFGYYTLKDQHILSEPETMLEMFMIDEVPVVIGFCVLETHKPVPNGLMQLGSQLQQEANEIANQRLDNVKFVLNKRWVIRRGANIDVENMLRNVPGGVTMASDVEKDVREINWQDVTSSSFQEQDRLNADFDDLEGGGLNSSSVMTNRRMNETVGGMKMMNQGASQLGEYTIRVFIETWAEPVLRQFMQLEQACESDMTVIALAAQRAGVWQRFGQNPNLDQLLKKELTLSINIGMGATDPEARFQRFMQAMGAYTQISQAAPPDSNILEIRKELFGLAGFKDSKRFFTKVDPRLAQAQELAQKAEQIAMGIIEQHKDRIQRRERALDEREHQISGEMAQAQNELQLDLKKLMGEFALKQKEQQFNFLHKAREGAQNMKLKEIEHQHDMQLKTFEAKLDASLERFKAVAAAKAQMEAAKHAPQRESGERVH